MSRLPRITIPAYPHHIIQRGNNRAATFFPDERDRAGQYSISVNDQWRICFRFVDGDAYEVELTDYH